MIEKQPSAVGERVEKLCAVGGEERGHVVAQLNKRGLISRVSCPPGETRNAFKNSLSLKANHASAPERAPYDWTRTYRKGQTMGHPTFGLGEGVDRAAMDVLFADRIRRLIQARDRA